MLASEASCISWYMQCHVEEHAKNVRWEFSREWQRHLLKLGKCGRHSRLTIANPWAVYVLAHFPMHVGERACCLLLLTVTCIARLVRLHVLVTCMNYYSCGFFLIIKTIEYSCVYERSVAGPAFSISYFNFYDLASGESSDSFFWSIFFSSVC